MPKEEAEVAEKDDKKSNGKKTKPKQPCVLIAFKVNEAANWTIYPRFFNTEETALAKLEQSYPFEDHCFINADLP